MGEIDWLQQEIEWWGKSGIHALEDAQAIHSRRLAELRDELELELDSKCVVVFGTMHGSSL